MAAGFVDVEFGGDVCFFEFDVHLCEADGTVGVVVGDDHEKGWGVGGEVGAFGHAVGGVDGDGEVGFV